MAEIVTTIKRYLGTEAERAALDTTNINAGSTYFESDTGLLYVLDGAGNWQEKVLKVEGEANADIIKVAGMAQTGADWTPILQTLNDETVKGLLKTLGDIGADENLITRLGERDDVAQTDHTGTASVIAFLKGMTELLGGTLDAQLTGSIPEYMWLVGDAEPDPGDDGFTRAMGIEIDPANHEMTVKYYDGTNWEEVAD